MNAGTIMLLMWHMWLNPPWMPPIKAKDPHESEPFIFQKLEFHLPKVSAHYTLKP